MSGAIRTYVALGDSFTAGLDPARGRWPDEVARALGPAVSYVNLAAMGATTAEVEELQLPAALELEPDLISLVCGANDVLESVRPDPGEYAARLGRMLARVREQAPRATVVTATYPDISRFLDLRPRTHERVEKGMRLFNAACRAIARRHGALLLEGFDHPLAERRTSFAEDGFHPSPEGHRRAAAEFVAALEQRLGIQLRPMEEARA